MLPRALSSNLCSLLPDVDRLCLCVDVELDAGGNVVKSTPRPRRHELAGEAHLRRRGAGARPVERGRRAEPEADAMVEGLRVALELSRILRAQRMKRGALDFELPEAKVVLDETTREPIDVSAARTDPGVKKAYQLIEELMLLANETVARWCQERDDPDDLPRARAARRAEARPLRGDVRGAGHRVRRRGHARPEASSASCSSPSPTTRWRRVLNSLLLAVDEAGDLRRREHRPLRAGVEGVPALHLAHPPLPGPRRAPLGARGPRRARAAARTTRPREKLARGGAARRASPSGGRWRSSARSSTSTARS